MSTTKLVAMGKTLNEITELKNLMITQQPVMYVKVKRKKATGQFVSMREAKRRGLPLPGLDLTCDEEKKSGSRSTSFESDSLSGDSHSDLRVTEAD